MTLSREDRVAGCLLGGALGDAIGSAFEGGEPGPDFALPESLRITDDTQLTIATCESIAKTSAVAPEQIALSFLRWFRDRRITGIGSSTLKALTELDVGGHWAMVGATGERAAGNGAAMRVAPLAFFLDPDNDAQRQTIRDTCRITHRNDEAYIGALAILRTLRHVVLGGKLEPGFLPLLVDKLPDSRVRDRLADVCKHSVNIQQYANQFATSGYVVDSVPLAILAATESSDVLATIEQLVKTGGDTDTNASMFGQIYGAAHGVQSLPSQILAQIDGVTLVRDISIKLARTRAAD